MRGRGTFWPVTLTPPPWPSLTSDSTWSAERRFYIGMVPIHVFVDFKKSLAIVFFIYFFILPLLFLPVVLTL